jgi:hypothetical protein
MVSAHAQETLCAQSAAYLSYANNDSDSCYTQLFNDLSNNVMCPGDISNACTPSSTNSISYPDYYDGYISEGDCENFVTSSNLDQVDDALSNYYDCEASLGKCASGATQLIGNQPYYCSSNKKWTPTLDQGQACTTNLMCASNQCSKTCKGMDTVHAAPNFTNIAGQDVSQGQIPTVNTNNYPNFFVTATSPAGRALTYSASNLPTGPTGASFNASTGNFSWTPKTGQNGTFIVLFTATDTSGLQAYQPVQITAGTGIDPKNSVITGSISSSLPTSNYCSGSTCNNYPVTNTPTVSFNLTATETGGLGVSYMQFSSDGSRWGALVPFSTTGVYTLPKKQGINTVSVQFTDVTGNVSSAYSLSLMLANVITASAGPGGSISPSGSIIAIYGGSQTFTLTPNTGYSIGKLKVDGTAVTVSSSGTYTLSNIKKSHTVTASFNPEITANAGAGGSISPKGTVGVVSGANKTFTIKPIAGYSINQVLVDGNPVTLSKTNTYTFSDVTITHTIAASFTVSTYVVTASAGPGGSISPLSVSINYNGSQVFTVTPGTGYSIAKLKVDGTAVTVSSSGSYTLSNIKKSHTVTASFNPEITTSAGTGGSISPTGTVSVVSGANKTFTVKANAGYSIGQVLVDGSAVTLSSTNTYKFTDVTIPHTIAASFTTGYTVTANADTGGSISPSGSVSVAYEANQTFTLMPSTGYSIYKLKVDGTAVTVSSSGSYMLKNVKKDHTVTASFNPEITASAGTGGSISPTGTVSVVSEASKTFTIKASKGYSISSVSVDGSTVTLSKTNTYVFSDVAIPHTIAASFAK